MRDVFVDEVVTLVTAGIAASPPEDELRSAPERARGMTLPALRGT